MSKRDGDPNYLGGLRTRLLNENQRAFACLVAIGFSASAAYRIAINHAAQPSTCASAGSRLLGSEAVQIHLRSIYRLTQGKYTIDKDVIKDEQ